MRVTDTAGVTVLAPFVVTLSGPSQSYVGVSTVFVVSWSDSVTIPTVVTVEWGDGASNNYQTVGYSQQATHTYAAAGTFTVTAAATQAGKTRSDSAQITISSTVTATLDANPTSGEVPLSVMFSGVVSGGYSPYLWSIDFGDGTAPASGSGGTVSANHTYTSIGSYIATLTAEDSLGGATQLGVPIGVGLAADYWWLLLVPLGLGALYLAYKYL